MCFSPEMDVVAGLVVGAIGVEAVRHVRRSAEWPLAAIPLVFAAHQLIEAFVWWGVRGDVGHDVSRVALFLYLLVAFGVLPVLVPFAVGALEPVANRRRVAGFTVLGAVVAALLMRGVVVGPVRAVIEGHHLDYHVPLWHGRLLVGLYVIATCGSLLVSAHRHVRWFGTANVLVAGLLAWLAASAFISLWCLWAALTSFAIVAHLRRRDPSGLDDPKLNVFN